MKAEHREIIDRAKLHGYYPSTIAHELLERDLVNTVVTELRSVRVPFHLLKEDEQQEVIDRIAESVSEVTRVAISIIASRGAVSVPVDMKAIKVEAKTMTITAKVDGAEPNKHELTDAAGKLCLLVMAPSDYDEGLDDAGEVQACGVALPSGKGSPLADSPFLPFVLDASLFAGLKADDRRKLLLSLTGASASPAEVAKRLKAKGIDLALFEKVKPLLRSGFPAAVEQAKAYASEARGAWKAVTGENYGSEKANGWEPEAPPMEAFNAAAQRQDVIKQAAGFHAEVCAWSTLADALSPAGIPAEILADAIGPVNELLQRLSGTAGWSPVQISADIDVTFGGRLYGLLSESERWRCDATLALAIATISGLRLALLDRLDVLDLPSRSQALTLLRAVTMDKEIDSVIVAGTLKEPMAKTPAWLQAVWIDAGQLADQQQQAAA
ncbi:hypothetical protein [Pseudomonas aeruginosa]|uniref:hypothetical protein n=1 Tax=Pseudomonas aeruginosa TaxID=287 RepID=UPI002238EAEB|nr:hypothetical protein [Pseudomonas aeruginosa]